MDSQGRVYHIDCCPGDIAPYILTCANPDRAHTIADFLQEPELKKKNREYVIYTGSYKGIPLSVMGTGIGAKRFWRNCSSLTIRVPHVPPLIFTPVRGDR
jgi:uridine phosphorylase